MADDYKINVDFYAGAAIWLFDVRICSVFGLQTLCSLHF